MSRFYYLFFVALLVSACSSSEPSITAEQASIEYDLLYSLPKETISYEQAVRPVLEKRCIVCHGCYDAPCQLKLSAVAGIQRGANPKKVYDGARILADEPTRLFIDATTTEQWRQKGFHSVLNEGFNNPRRNLENSVMYKMLRLKQRHPQARVGMLDEAFDISLDRQQSCPTIEEMPQYTAEHPEGGMPYAMPNLNRSSYTTLVHWLAQGAPVPADKTASAAVAPQIRRWEAFFNGDSNKVKLVSRYIYEHLFQAHIHFRGSAPREFYRLVRSATPPGEPLKIIATRRPYGPPEGRVYYRLVRHQGSIVAKNHLVYEFSDERMQRYRTLFYQPDYTVDSLPGYAPAQASNPIKTFASIPVRSRYKFLLDDARLFIEGFIKGPVCRGQVALNVIEDQFWVVFFDPDANIASLDDAFLDKTVNYLSTPAELEDNFQLLASRTHYKKLFQQYAQLKQARAKSFKPLDLGQAMNYIWDGDGDNPNAALTVFRHFDSASVNFGLIGDYPETAWVLDYSVFERIHYLLVAGFDVYGNLGHQLNTRLYMDFLRTEGEDYFLAFLPAEKRARIRNAWYKGIRRSDLDDSGFDGWLAKTFVTGYTTDDPQREMYDHLQRHLGKLAGRDVINRCEKEDCLLDQSDVLQRVNKGMQLAASMHGEIMKILPDLAFVRVKLGGRPEDDLAYSLISNKAYKSVSSMFEAETLFDRRDFAFDTQTVVPWLEGVYPNFFYVVELKDIDDFVHRYQGIENREQYEIFVARYGIRRTDDRFWETSDWFNQYARRTQPVLSGIFDLNRYENR